ncbi:MAG: hypothetical protein JKY93_12510 [Gammaproteobacteria bacterium]|nr:hypothetical protein [Gammaproteobacteria bacterium]
MAFSPGAAIPALDSAFTHVDVNSVTTSLLTDGSMDSEAKVALPAGVFCDLSFKGQLAAIGDVGATIYIYRRDKLADGVSDADVPTLLNKAIFVGVFSFTDSLAANTDTVIKQPAVPLNMEGESELFFENDTGQTIKAGWVVTITNISYSAQA